VVGAGWGFGVGVVVGWEGGLERGGWLMGGLGALAGMAGCGWVVGRG
jgi:hypothetical protein